MAISDLFTDPLVNFGLGLSAGGGPSPFPRSFGQAALGGLQQGQTGLGLRSDLQTADVNRRLREEQITDLQQNRQLLEESRGRIAQILGGPGATGLQPTTSTTPPLGAAGGVPQTSAGLPAPTQQPGTGLAGSLQQQGQQRSAQLIAAAAQAGQLGTPAGNEIMKQLLSEGLKGTNAFSGLPADAQNALAISMSPQQLATTTGLSVGQAAEMQDFMRNNQQWETVYDPMSPTERRMVPRNMLGNLPANMSQFPAAPQPSALVNVGLGGAPSFKGEKGDILNNMELARQTYGPEHPITKSWERLWEKTITKTPEQAGRLAGIRTGFTTLRKTIDEIAPIDGYDQNGKPIRRLAPSSVPGLSLAALMVDLPGFDPGLPKSEGRRLAVALEDVLQTKLRIETGAAANEKEIESIMRRFMPSRATENEATTIDKLERLMEFYTTAIDLTEWRGLAETLRNRAAKQGIQPVNRSPLLDFTDEDFEPVDAFGENEAESLRQELGVQ